MEMELSDKLQTEMFPVLHVNVWNFRQFRSGLVPIHQHDTLW